MAAELFDEEAATEGVVIAGRYELGSQLGVGGMGIVWRGRDRRLARAVAVKVLSKTSVGSEVARTRLIREARAAAALEHEGIIRVYDVGETDDGGAFLVMELIRGQSLRGVLERGTMRLGSRAGVIVQAARALQFAHEAGIVHRDVKPDNIMIREDGRVCVVDFGVAKPLSSELVALAGTVAGTPPAASLTGPGQLVGTPAYLAPEQARGLDVTAATDQFALAVTAFEALSGTRPWGGNCFSDVIASLLRDAPLTISEAAPLPRALDEVFDRALAKDPRDRFSDIGAFANALEDATADLELDEPLSLRGNSRRTPVSPRNTGIVVAPAARGTAVLTPPSMPISVLASAPAPAPAPASPSLSLSPSPSQSLATAPTVSAPVAATPAAIDPTTTAESVTSTLISSLDAAKGNGAAPVAAASKAPSRGSRWIVALALGVTIATGVAWSLGRAPQLATTPPQQQTAVAPVETTSPTSPTTTPELPSTAAKATAPSSSTSTSATAEPSARTTTAVTEPSAVPRAPTPPPSIIKRAGSAAPLPSTSPAALVATSSALSGSAIDATPRSSAAPKPTGRRVRTEL